MRAIRRIKDNFFGRDDPFLQALLKKIKYIPYSTHVNMHIESFGATAPRKIFSTHVATENVGLSTTACVCVGDEIESFDENTLR